jgi:type IV secretory pathway VirB10-like protein
MKGTMTTNPATIHLTLQGKGGVGKSLVASILAQYFRHQELTQTGAQITRRNLNVQPTIKVPAGYKFTVRVNRDILFESPYQPVTVDDRRRDGYPR